MCCNWQSTTGINGNAILSIPVGDCRCLRSLFPNMTRPRGCARYESLNMGKVHSTEVQFAHVCLGRSKVRAGTTITCNAAHTIPSRFKYELQLHTNNVQRTTRSWRTPTVASGKSYYNGGSTVQRMHFPFQRSPSNPVEGYSGAEVVQLWRFDSGTRPAQRTLKTCAAPVAGGYSPTKSIV